MPIVVFTMGQVLGANESSYNIIEEQLPCYDFQYSVVSCLSYWAAGQY
jgi:hypothetical protein